MTFGGSVRVLSAAVLAGTVALTGCTQAPPPVSESVQKYYDENVAGRKVASKDTAAPVVAFLGDSYTSGSGANPGGGYAMLLAYDMGWEAKVFGQGGTGYTNAGQAEQKEEVFGGRVADVVAAKPDVVIVQGSTNDYDLEATRVAADAVFSQLRARLPKAKIVAVGPLNTPATPPILLDASRSGVAAAAATNRVMFIDPIKLNWLAEDTLYPDGVHPSQEGHRMMADLLRKALAGAGIKPAP